MILSTDQKIKLKQLFENKKFSEIEHFVESLGDLKKLPSNLINIYATSKALNKNSKINDYKISAYCFEKIYLENNSNRDAFYNLIIVSVKATYFEYLEEHIVKEYNLNNKDPKILEGLAKMNFFYNNMEKASFFYEKLLEINPNFKNIWSSFLASLNYHNKYDQKKYLEFCNKFDQFLKLEIDEFTPNVKKNEKIKIGFLSADFKYHSVSLFLNDLIKKLNKEEFELFAISNLEKNNHDEMTNDLKDNFDQWYDVSNTSDIESVKLIRSLNLDILIDLAGHTYKNRVSVIRARCAPKQILWLGYNNSLGVENIDYIIADPNLVKKEEYKLYKEKIIFMPKIWNALSKPIDLPEINFYPDKDNCFRYGSFNNFQKISSETIKTWSKILKDGDAKLILKSSTSFEEKNLNKYLINKFKKLNIGEDKIEILSRKKTYSEHLENYNKIDLSLDTFPYPGVTTSFESVSMGTPVLTMKGFNFNSRCGESINKNLNLEHFIANNEDDYIDKALTIKKENKIDQKYKQNLRSEALKSCLFDTETFAKDFGSLLKSL